METKPRGSIEEWGNWAWVLFILGNLSLSGVFLNRYVHVRQDISAVNQALNNTWKGRQDVLVYNRVPKAGSTSMIYLLNTLSQRNNFSNWAYRIPDTIDCEIDSMGPIEEAQTIEHLSEGVGDRSYFKHMYFIDFERYNMSNPIYFSMVRHPIDRLDSWYYYVRQTTYILGNQSDIVMPVRRLKLTLDECVLQFSEGCGLNMNEDETGRIKELIIQAQEEKSSVRRVSKLKLSQSILEQSGSDEESSNSKSVQSDKVSSQVKYFCGYGPDCILNFPWKVLQKAIGNVDQFYSVVGVLEEMTTTLTVLESFIPRFFEGASQIKHEKSNKTFSRPKLSEKAKKLLQEFLEVEILFYEYCKQRLHKQHQALQLNSIL